MCMKKGCKITLNHSLSMNMKGSDFVTWTRTWVLFVLPFYFCKWACYCFIIDLLFKRGCRFEFISYVWQKPCQPLEQNHTNRPNYRFFLPQAFLPLHVAQKHTLTLEQVIFSFFLLLQINSFLESIIYFTHQVSQIINRYILYFLCYLKS